MPTHYKNTSDSYFIDGGDNASIMKNFLFRNEANDIPDGQASVFKLNADVFDNITSPAIFDLSKIYNGQSVGRTQDHIEIFDPKTDDEH
jgi:hypothetical protein